MNPSRSGLRKQSTRSPQSPHRARAALLDARHRITMFAWFHLNPCHKQSAAQLLGPRRPSAPSPVVNVNHDHPPCFSVCAWVEDKHQNATPLTTVASEPQRARRRSAKNASSCWTPSHHLFHEQRLLPPATGSKTRTSTLAPQAKRCAPIAGSSKNASAYSGVGDVNHELLAAISGPRPTRESSHPFDPVATRSAPVAGSTVRRHQGAQFLRVPPSRRSAA